MVGRRVATTVAVGLAVLLGACAPAPRDAPTSPPVNCAVDKCVALTFDDGPLPGTTDRILDALAAHGAKATFFVTGELDDARCELLRREHADGHVIGNHTRHHKDLTKLSVAEAQHEMGALDDELEACGVPRTTLVRPPFGAVPDDETTAAKRVVMWDVDTSDWRDRDAAVVTQRIVEQARPGAIILCHDIRPTTADAIPAAVAALLAQGYHLVTVPELLPPVPGH